MDIPSRTTKTSYWQQQQSVNQTRKNSIKSNVDLQDAPYYGNNNQLKRRHSGGSDQQGSPPKNHHFDQQNTLAIQTDEDDDDDDDESESISSKTPNGIKQDDNTRRRAAHSASEQRRRNAIRKGYDTLQNLVPNSHLLDPISSQKVSKAAILKRSTDYLLQLNEEKQQLSRELEKKKNETFCLRTVQKTYEDMVEMNLHSIKNSSTSIDFEQKFTVFENISDGLFVSFDQAMQSAQVTDFTQFTSTVLRWIEDSCRPTDINEIIRRVLTNSTI